MQVGKKYKFKSYDHRMQYKIRNVCNESYGARIRKDTFTVLVKNSMSGVSKIELSNGECIIGEIPGDSIISQDEFNFFVEVVDDVVDNPESITIERAIEIYKKLCPVSNPENATVKQLMTAISDYREMIAAKEQQIKKLQMELNDLKNI